MKKRKTFPTRRDSEVRIADFARKFGQERNPWSTAYHAAAFVNAMVYLMKGVGCYYGGPSLRDHLISRRARRLNLVGVCSFRRAIRIAEPLAYGPIGLDHALIVAAEEVCFDDPPGDLETARILLRTMGGEVGIRRHLLIKACVQDRLSI